MNKYTYIKCKFNIIKINHVKKFFLQLGFIFDSVILFNDTIILIKSFSFFFPIKNRTGADESNERMNIMIDCLFLKRK